MKRAISAISIVFVLTAGVMVGAAYSDYKTALRKAQKNLTAVKEEVPKWTDTSMAWFTLVLTAATLFQVLLWIKSNKTAEMANQKADTNIDLTRKSIAAMEKANEIAAEWIEQDARIESGAFAFEAGSISADNSHVKFTLRNIGRGAIKPIIAMIYFRDGMKDSSEIRMPSSVAALNVLIGNDELLRLGHFIDDPDTEKGNLMTSVPPSVMEDDPVLVNIDLVVIYDVAIGKYQYEQTFVIHWLPKARHLSCIHSHEMRFRKSDPSKTNSVKRRSKESGIN